MRRSEPRAQPSFRTRTFAGVAANSVQHGLKLCRVHFPRPLFIELVKHLCGRVAWPRELQRESEDREFAL